MPERPALVADAHLCRGTRGRLVDELAGSLVEHAQAFYEVDAGVLSGSAVGFYTDPLNALTPFPALEEVEALAVGAAHLGLGVTYALRIARGAGRGKTGVALALLEVGAVFVIPAVEAEPLLRVALSGHVLTLGRPRAVVGLDPADLVPTPLSLRAVRVFKALHAIAFLRITHVVGTLFGTAARFSLRAAPGNTDPLVGAVRFHIALHATAGELVAESGLAMAGNAAKRSRTDVLFGRHLHDFHDLANTDVRRGRLVLFAPAARRRKQAQRKQGPGGEGFSSGLHCFSPIL